MVYNEHLLQITNNDMDYDSYQEAILQAGALTATHHKKQCTGWFQMSPSTLAPLITERNQILHALKRSHHLSPTIHAAMHSDPKRLNRHIAHAVSHAKATWYADVCSKIHNMCMDPRLAWEHIRLLTKGEAAHHEKRRRWRCVSPTVRVLLMHRRICQYLPPTLTEYTMPNDLLTPLFWPKYLNAAPLSLIHI